MEAGLVMNQIGEHLNHAEGQGICLDVAIGSK